MKLLLTVFACAVSSCFSNVCAGPLPPPSGLVSWWDGDGTSADLEGKNNGVLLDGVAFAGGKVGRAFKFDGINAEVQAGTAGLPIGNADRTLEL
jgi:hypothetical protein